MTVADQRQRILQIQAKHAAEDWAVANKIGYDGPVVQVPSGEAGVAALSTERREAHRAHLREALSDALGNPGEPDAVDDPDDHVSADLAARSAQICTACRGACCAGGGNHAFIGEDEIKRQLALHPQRKPEQLLTLWLKHLPETIIAGGCVYQGERGCTLPRKLRSDLCNTYHCSPLDAWRDHAVTGEPLTDALVIQRSYTQQQRTSGGHDAAIERVLHIDEHGVHLLDN